MTNYNELRDGQEFYANGYKQGYEDAKKKFERPTGRWIDKSGVVQKANCSNCNKTTVTEPYGEPDYCPNCGADMRGGRE